MTSIREEKLTMQKSKRIASNTLVLFARMLAITVINLYAVRIVLASLGAVDYGIFNAVAGVILTSTFINTTLAISIQRFYSYAIGEHDEKRLRQIFSSSINITIVLSIIVIIFFETGGSWFIEAKMIEPVGKIPYERLQATLWIFQFALFTFVFTLIQLPFTSAIFAHEDMGTYAVISFLECAGRLLVAFLIGKFAADGLIFYGAGLLLVAFIVYIAYASIASYRYKECRYRKVTDKGIYSELLFFSGWAMYGAIAGVAIIQGSNILLSLFFGPIAVACYAIANQIYNAVHSLSSSILLAFRPAMVKSYAEKQYDFLNQLFNASNKFTLYILVAISLPLIAEMRTILTWWLDNTREDTVLFSRLMIVMMVILAMHNPITTVIQSTGKVKHYYLIVDTLTLSCIPLTWLFFKAGYQAFFAFISMITVCIIAHAIRLLCLKKVYPLFCIRNYLKTLVLPSVIIILINMVVTYALHNQIRPEIIRFLCVFILSPLATLLLVYRFGISQQEKLLLSSFIKNYIKH